MGGLKLAQKFRRTEVTRAILAAEKAHQKVAGVDIRPDGTLSLVFGQPDAPSDDKTNEWDDAAA
jgi:hypothetical protein